mgnify:CR=1 FL=1
MTNFPFHKQLDQMDCGAACIKMIADYYRATISIDKIRELCEQGVLGVNMKGICNAFESLGFNVIAGKVTFKDLCEKANMPCILHWNQNHFVVLYKVRKRANRYIFYVADPGKTLLKYGEKEFAEKWISTVSNSYEKGSVVLVEPSTQFSQDWRNANSLTKSINRFKFIWAYSQKYKYTFLQIIYGLVVTSLIFLLIPFLTKSIVDFGISTHNLNFIWLVLVGQLMLAAGNVLIDFIRNRLLLYVGTRINISLISDFFVKLMRLPLSFFETKMLGDLLQRVEDHKRIERFMTSLSLNVIFSFIAFIVYGVVLGILEFNVFIVFFCSSILYGGWLMLFVKKRRLLDFSFFEQQAKNQNITYQLINSIQETKLHNAENRKRWEWEDVQADLFNVNMEILKLQQNQAIGCVLLTQFRNILITIIAATSVMTGDITLGTMLAIQFIVGELNSPIEQILALIYNWQDISISMERINDIQCQKEENQDRIIKKNVSNDKSLYIRNLSFRYPGTYKNVLSDLNLTIPEGKITAIVGSSGSGKTTLLKLLLGYYSNFYGEINIGNTTINSINLKWWHSKCGAVMQNGFIYSDSIAGNIAVSENEPDKKKLLYAAKISNVDKIVEELPLKFNTMIGDDGQGLSQGQKQRILIARAVYNNPEYIFLDEATNSLDANNEMEIVRNLSAFCKGKTVVIIAHRLSTVKNADQIVVLENGKIVEIGNHTELTSLKGKYYQLVKNQLEFGC